MIDFYMLHGFLGRGSDWEPLKEKIRKKYKDSFYRQPDLFFQPHHDLSSQFDMPQWAINFNAWARETQASLENRKRVLMGYSMGGRLALHALLHRQSQWDAAIIMSANPGIFWSTEEIQKRRNWDEIWAQDFLNKDWTQLIEKWHQLPVFSGDPQPYRLLEEQFSRAALSLAFKNWSVLNHGFELEDLKKISIPVLWVVGERDQKYCHYYEYLKKEKYIDDYIVIPRIGHRILRAEDPELLLGLLFFLDRFL